MFFIYLQPKLTFPTIQQEYVSPFSSQDCRRSWAGAVTIPQKTNPNFRSRNPGSGFRESAFRVYARTQSLNRKCGNPDSGNPYFGFPKLQRFCPKWADNDPTSPECSPWSTTLALQDAFCSKSYSQTKPSQTRSQAARRTAGCGSRVSTV